VRLLLDECVDARVAAPVRMLGHDMALVHVVDPSADDRAVLRLAVAQRRVLVPVDLDFGELLVRGGLRSTGVALLRLEGLAPEEAARRVDASLAAHGARLAGHLLVSSTARATAARPGGTLTAERGRAPGPTRTG
jgi:predicted nuclease of predicted toxin-antitoxin system